MTITNYHITIEKEEEITWQIQNQIHRVLNIAFDGLSKKFIAKTYGYERPEERVLGWENGMVVSHMGIRNGVLILGEQRINVSCLGLWSSISQTKGWATEICKASMNRLKENGVRLGVGMTSNEVIIKYVTPKFASSIKLLNYPIIGSNYASNVGTLGMLFNINMPEDEFNEVISRIEQEGKIKLLGEPF